MGVSNILARINNTFTPLVAELPQPIPLVFCIVYCFMAVCGASMLKNAKDNKVQTTEETVHEI